MNLITPTTEGILAQCKKPIPLQARIEGVIDFLKSENIKGKKNAVS